MIALNTISFPRTHTCLHRAIFHYQKQTKLNEPKSRSGYFYCNFMRTCDDMFNRAEVGFEPQVPGLRVMQANYSAKGILPCKQQRYKF